MSNTIWNSSGIGAYYGNYNASQIFDVAGAQNSAKLQARQLMDKLSGTSGSVTSLTADTAKYLDQYTLSMKTLANDSNKVRFDNLDKLLYNKSGEMTDDTVKNTVKAVQNMVDSYNDTMKLLNNNADRGPGTLKQLGRMATDPAPADSMKLVGITVNKDGTLKVDAEKMTEALKTQTPGQAKLFKDIIGGVGGLADNINKRAVAGLNVPVKELVKDDLASIQATQNEANPFREMYSAIRGNVYALSNQMAAGMLMNFLA